MTTHSNRIKALVLSIAFILCVVIVPFDFVKADSFPSEFYVNSEVYYSAEEMYLAYQNLNFTQQQIASYLLGMYNLMYLGSRGFGFRAGAYRNESSFMANIRSMGYWLLQGGAEVSIKSRMDGDFCKYASACILYASQCNVSDFDTWFDNLDQDFTLPVDQGILNSFTLLFDNNSVDAITDVSNVISPWESGEDLDLSVNTENDPNYQTWLDSIYDTYNYVIISSINTQYSDFNSQLVAYSNEVPDTIFVKRGLNYNQFAYGNYYGGDFHRLNFENYSYKNINVQISTGNVSSIDGGPVNFTSSVFNTDSYSDISDYIYFVFNSFSPISTRYGNMTFAGYYPYIFHVVLVDDLMTLSNAEEIYNNDSWDIIGLGDNMVVPIDKVDIKPKVITTINLPDNIQDIVPIQDIINDDNTVDSNTGDPVDPWQRTIIVQPNDTNPISVSVNLFTGAKSYVQYLWESSEKFIKYCADLLSCFEYNDSSRVYGPKIAIFGVVTLGIAGGLIAKFLL